jgi:hypothetical protein
MSSTINVYAVSIDRLNQLLGSRDQAEIDAVVSSHKGFLATIDDIDDEAEMTCAQAVAELVNGSPDKDGPGYLYGYALEALCAYAGEELPNICGIVGASRWIEETDALLERLQVPLRLMDLVYRGSPVPIPDPDDSPCIGRWPADQIPTALAALRAVDFNPLDRDAAETLEQIRGWLEAAAREPGASIVGFLS